MSQRLPIGQYKCIPGDNYRKNISSILNLNDDSDIGYIFEVDLHYPAELHDKHNDFPFCAEKRIIPGITKCEKLMLTFYDKEKYIVYYKMLKFS